MKQNLQKVLAIFFLATGLLMTLGSQVNGQNITTYAGTGTPPNNNGYSGNGGQATAAQLNGPAGIAFDDTGNLYIADLYNSVIRKISISGVISTIAGRALSGYSGDGGQATLAKLDDPTGVCTDAAGNIYIADNQNNRIRKVTASTGIITTIAGYGTPPYNAGFSGDGGTATLAELDEPYDVVADNSGDIFFSDYTNNRVREISGGIITTVAGTGNLAYNGDNKPATAANLSGPEGIALDDSGNLYIADIGNNRIRKVNTAGVITTVAGNGSPGWSGDNGAATAAELQTPTGVIIDGSGNLFIADHSNYRIRKVSNGTITSIAGNGNPGYSGDGGQALLAELNNPNDVALDTAGNVYIADFANNRIRELSGCSFAVGLSPQSATICSDSSLTITASGGTTYTWTPATGLSATTGDSVIANPSVTTTYTVTSFTTGGAGCAGVGTDIVYVQPSPSKPVITVSGDTLISSATQGNQWYRNDSILTGATGQTYIYSVVGNYTVKAKNPVNGCAAFSNPVNPTGINQLSISSDLLSIYPNPTSGEIEVNISSTVATVKDWRLQITDVLGRTLYTRSSLNYNNIIDLSNLSVGMYFITVINKTARGVFPVVRQN
jgi:trimeric autotransporter adhesin